jgi:DNA gyrase subunit B
MGCPGQPPEYSEENIVTLSGLEHVRRRPLMYIGDTDARGLFTLLFELVTQSLEEVVAGHGRSVRVALRADGFAEVADDGRTWPASNPPAGMPTIEQAFAEFGYGYRWNLDPYRTCGLHDIGYPIANALSERLRVLVRTDGSVYQHVFTRGVTSAVVESAGPPGDRGLTVKFRPDPDIFGDARFDADAIRDRLRQLAYLHSGARITFTDEATGTRDEFEYADGIREYVRFLNANRRPLRADVIVLRGEEQGVRYEVGLQWCEDEGEMRLSFANYYCTPQGGTHDSGLRAGVTAGVRDFIQTTAADSGKFESEDLRAGLTAVVSVWLTEPQFSGATRERLSNPEVEPVVKAAVRRDVCDYFEANRKTAERVVEAVVAARDARGAATAERRKKKR